MPKAPEIKTNIIVEQTIEQTKPKPISSTKFSKEEEAYLEWVRTRDNDKILQSMSWRGEE